MNPHEPRAIITSRGVGPDGEELFQAIVPESEVNEQLTQIILNGGAIVSVQPIWSRAEEDADRDQRLAEFEGAFHG